MPLAAVISPRSIIDRHPNVFRSSTNLPLASASFPHTNASCSPGTRNRSTITLQFIVSNAFARGKARCICSPNESELHTASVGGIPFEKSKGLATSIKTFPLRLLASAEVRAAKETVPTVQLKTTSPSAAASAKVPTDAWVPFCFAHSTALSYLPNAIPSSLRARVERV